MEQALSRECTGKETSVEIGGELACLSRSLSLSHTLSLSFSLFLSLSLTLSLSIAATGDGDSGSYRSQALCLLHTTQIQS